MKPLFLILFVSLAGCTTAEEESAVDAATEGLDGSPGADFGRADTAAVGSSDSLLDAQPGDGAPVDLGAARDRGPDRPSTDAAIENDQGGDAAVGSDAASDVGVLGPDMGGPSLDCDALAQAGHDVCGATAEACQIVFYDGSGCSAACESAGYTCLDSFRDDDDDAPVCAIHQSRENFACADTGHQSDYCVCGPRQRAFEGAEGFGAFTAGGRGGDVFTVTNLNDSGEGSLRWAVERRGRRIVQFDVDGVIQLRSALRITEPNITIDGRGALDAGERGITVRDYPIDIRTSEVVIRYLRVRLGDYAVLRRNDQQNRNRPDNSNDLDCINIDQARNVILDHLSMSWSADEIVSVTNSENITIQWSILSEPLGRRELHPYGDNHAYAANNSAATLTYHHNLFAHYRFRGPQFEANDMQASDRPFDAKFEAVNNVIYGYTSSGSRYRTGFERDQDRTDAVDFMYHFVGNRYVNPNGGRSEIQAHTDYGYADNIHVHVRGNIGPNRPRDDQDELNVVFTDSGADDRLRRSARSLAQFSEEPLFQSPAPVVVQSAAAAYDAVLGNAGCSIERDAIDDRVIEDVRRVRPGAIQSSQSDVPGGWATYQD